ncbi:MAG: hypothetical protein AAGC46_10285 [Solirubrobacteraceae bacterium]|nr:hypothetical protein [Patulibacter sp.]
MRSLSVARYVLVGTAVCAVCAGTAEGTAHLISGKQIAKRSIPGDRLKKNSVTLADLSPGVRSAITAAGRLGATGPAGAKGDKGDKGDTGAAGGAGQLPLTEGTSGVPTPNPTPSPTPTATPAPTTPLQAARTITASDLQGWVLAPQGDNEDPGTNGSVDFATPPLTSPLGDKALELSTTNGKSVVAYLPLPVGNDNPRLSELRVAGFASDVISQDATGTDVSLQFEVLGSTSTHFGNGYTTVVFDPGLQPGSNPAGAWNRHYLLSGSTIQGSVYSTQAASSSHPTDCTISSPCSFGTWIGQNPNAVVQTAKLRIGQNSGAGWVGFDAFVDDVRLAFDTTEARYDLGG